VHAVQGQRQEEGDLMKLALVIIGIILALVGLAFLADKLLEK